MPPALVQRNASDPKADNAPPTTTEPSAEIALALLSAPPPGKNPSPEKLLEALGGSALAHAAPMMTTTEVAVARKKIDLALWRFDDFTLVRLMSVLP